MLIEMKKNLNFFYREKKIHVIITMILASITVAWRSTYTNTDILTHNDIKYNFAASYDKNDCYMSIEIFVCIIDVFLPLSLLMYNIKTINFEKYLKNLLKGFDYK